MLPPYVKQAIQKLDDAGHVAYVVGGSVRDNLLNRPTKDHDIATSARPDELERLFPDAITVGKAFGVLKVPVEGSPQLLEIATFRQDLEYKDYRRPSKVKFTGPEEDARRRDFTINALFYDVKTSRILDTVHGMKDLESKMIRAIGDPSERFKEDALRLLRAVRFTTTLGFSIDPATADALRERAKLIRKVSAERIRDELTLMLKGPNPVLSLSLLSDLGLLNLILPELARLKGLNQVPAYHPGEDVWKHTLRVVKNLELQNPTRSATLSWATLLHDIGKPIASSRSGGKNFNAHEIDGAKLAAAVAERLKMSREEVSTIASLVENQLKFKDVFQMRESTLQRFIREPHFEELLALHRADASASDGNLAFYEFCQTRLEELKRQPQNREPKLVTGQDLIQLGFQPGPKFSEILRTIEDLTLEKKLHSKEEALEYVVKHFVS